MRLAATPREEETAAPTAEDGLAHHVQVGLRGADLEKLALKAVRVQLVRRFGWAPDSLVLKTKLKTLVSTEVERIQAAEPSKGECSNGAEGAPEYRQKPQAGTNVPAWAF